MFGEFNRHVIRHNMWTAISEARVNDGFQPCLGGNALNTWIDVAISEDEVSLDDNLADLVESLIEEEAYDNQLDYLKEAEICPSANGYFEWRPLILVYHCSKETEIKLRLINRS